MANEFSPTFWNASTNPYLSAAEVLKDGDKSGYGMVVHFTIGEKREIYAISLPHEFPTRTGPTWAYLMYCKGWTLVDAGPRGALDTLEEGLRVLGLNLIDLKRVIITHGHQDHDGNAYDLVNASGAELWAHELYFHFLPYEYSRTGLDKESPLHRVIYQVNVREGGRHRNRTHSAEDTQWRDHYRSYITGHRNILEHKLPVHAIRDGEELEWLRFLYVPGHAVDEICVVTDGVMFTGDHILPQITPHPTIKRTYPEAILNTIPTEYRDRQDHYGLACYLQSLGKTLKVDQRMTVFPAHRLFNHGRFNIRNLQRAKEILRHHVRRLEHVMEVMTEGADTPVKVTEELFPRKKLIGGGFFAAVSEVVSHLELLADVGDIEVAHDGKITSNRTDRFRSKIESITT